MKKGSTYKKRNEAIHLKKLKKTIARKKSTGVSGRTKAEKTAEVRAKSDMLRNC